MDLMHLRFHHCAVTIRSQSTHITDDSSEPKGNRIPADPLHTASVR